MGRRGEVFTTRLDAGDRTYFFNVKENIHKDLSLNIVESKGTPDSGRFVRQSLIVYQEDLGSFLDTLQQAVDAIKKHMADRED